MNILLTNHSLERVGGTEKWTHTMARELARRGHDVDVSTLMQGETSRRMHSFARIADRPLRDAYDLILANHPTTTFWSRRDAVEGYKVFTCHGPTHRLESPISGADAYVAVSSEVRMVRLTDGFQADWQVITNGVDLEEFTPAPKRRRHVLVACKNGDAGNMAIEAAIRNGCTWEAVHYIAEPVWDMAAKMAEADIVIGCGRTATEALACGCQVLVYDMRSKPHGPRTDGWLDADNVDHLRQFNFSTRGRGDACDLDQLTALLGQPPEATGWQRAWAEREADVRQKADEYLALPALTTRSGIDAAPETQEWMRWAEPVPDETPDLATTAQTAPSHQPDLTAEYTT